jgi:hypothetical protein
MFSSRFSCYAVLGAVLCLTACDDDIKPAIVVNEPQDHIQIQAPSIKIKGRVVPASAGVAVTGCNHVSPNSGGNFECSASLRPGDNKITVQAWFAGNENTKTLTITRPLTEEELRAQKAAAAKAVKERAAALAAYARTPAGRLCTKHPRWTRDDCENVARHRIWIGMTLEMVEAMRGRPDHANPSNYGSGTRWQWCWDDYTPSCFYGEDDHIITAYN